TGDVLALDPYGDQPLTVLDEMFGDAPDVAAASAFKSQTLLVDGRVVPGVAVHPIKNELWPTILRGEPPRALDEVVLSAETLSAVGADIGDSVGVQIVNFTGQQVADAMTMRVVGVATFPPVSQPGFDQV